MGAVQKSQTTSLGGIDTGQADRQALAALHHPQRVDITH